MASYIYEEGEKVLDGVGSVHQKTLRHGLKIIIGDVSYFIHIAVLYKPGVGNWQKKQQEINDVWHELDDEYYYIAGYTSWGFPYGGSYLLYSSR